MAVDNQPSNIHFNLSHSGNLIVMALAKGRGVGIDIEQLRTPRNFAAVAKRYFPEELTAELAALPETEQKRAFLNCWTQFEAYQKAIGEGLRGDYKPLKLNPNLDGKLAPLTTTDGHSLNWLTARLDLDGDYLGTVVVEAGVAESEPSYRVSYHCL